MISSVTSTNKGPNPYRDITTRGTSGRIALDPTGNPVVVKRAPKLFFEHTLDFIHGYRENDNIFLRRENTRVVSDFIKRNKEIYGETVFNFAFPLKEQKRYLAQGLVFSTEKNKEILATADHLFESITNASLPGVDKSVKQAYVIAEELQKNCAALEDPNTHLSEALQHSANIAAHCALLTAVFWHPVPLTAHVVADIAEVGIFTRADIVDKFEKITTAFSRFSNAREARDAAHDAVKTAIYNAETSLKQLKGRESTPSPTSIDDIASSHEDRNITALREIITSLKTTLRSIES